MIVKQGCVPSPRYQYGRQERNTRHVDRQE